MIDSQTIKKNQGENFAQMKNQKKSFLTENLFQDLVEGKNEWLNIQLIIREAFKQVKEAIENQYFYFDKIESKIEEKIDSKEVQKQLNKKATVDEIGNLLKDFNNQIQQKIDLRTLIENLNQYTLKNEFQKQILNIHESLKDQNSKFAMITQQDKLEQKIRQLEQKLDQINQQQSKNVQINDQKKYSQQIEQILQAKDKQIQELQNQYTLIQIDLQNKKDKKELQKEFTILCNDQMKIQKKNEAKIQKNQLQIDGLQNQIDLKADIDDIENIVEKYDEKFLQYESYQIKENQENLFKSIKIIEDQLEQQKLLTKQNLQKKIDDVKQNIEEIELKFDKQIQNIDIKNKFEDFQTQMIMAVNEIKNQQRNLQNKTKQITEQTIICIEKNIKNLNDQVKRNSNQILSVSSQQLNLKDQIPEMLISQKNDYQAQLDLEKNQIFKKQRKFDKAIQQITKNLEGINETKVNLTRFTLLEKKIIQSLDQKCSIDQFRQAINEMNLNYTKVQDIFKESQQNLFKNQQKDFKTLLRKKTSNEELNNILKDFTHRSDLEQSQNLLCSAIRNNEDKYNILNKKIDQILNLEFNMREFKKLQIEVPKIQENLLKKIERGDIQYLLNQKANTQQINAILEQLQTKINKKVSKKDIDKLMEEQNHFNKFFCTELILARYKWKSGLQLDNNVIPFDTEIVNTLKENFIWQKNSGILHIINGGLYEVKYGFFGQKKPIVQILINQNVVFRSKNEKQTNKKNSQNWMFSNNGATGISYFLIADDSQIQIQCIGELVVEGFFNIKRF